MKKVKEVIEVIESLAPTYLKEDFDNVGLMVGDKEKEANAVGVRSRKEGDIGAQDLKEFISKIKEEIENYVR
jgi:threonyl-tRNA synthetase